MTPREKLKSLVLDVFLIGDADFRWDLTREQIPTWDSIGTVSLSVGLQETFNCELTQDEALGLRGLPDVVELLRRKGVVLDP